MLIDNLVSLTFAELQNIPNVRDCYEIAFDCNNVRRGDLFVASDANSVKEAINNGAYALLYDFDIEVSDSEIAWIKVDCVHSAVKRILRHLLLELHVNIFSMNRISVNIVKTIHQDTKLHVITDASLQTVYSTIKKLSLGSILLIDDSLVDRTLYSTCKNFTAANKVTIKPKEMLLFQSSLLINNSYYENLRVSPLLLPYLQTSLDFFQFNNLEFCITKVAQLNHFEPLFLNRALVIKEYGSSENVLILESNEALFCEAVDFLRDKAAWSTILVLTPLEFNIKKYDNISYKTFESPADIMTILKQKQYNFMLLLHDSSLKERFNDAKETQQLTFSL
ncbi:MAG: hypothetical protein U9P71_03815 [Campylobacterota bacterium]|nr:hypothetical protein [Campylobacterota bacterium]